MPSPSAHAGRAADLVMRSTVIDMLAPLNVELRDDAHADRLDGGQIAAFRASGISAWHHSVGIIGREAYQEALAFVAAWAGFVGRNSDLFTLVGRADDIDAARRANRIAVIIGIQNADHFRTADDVRFFHDLGQRVSQLTYNAQNLIGTGSTERVDSGLSQFGVSIVEAMNEARMLVDLAHAGARTTFDAIACSAAPVAITHGNCRALNDHPRNVSDEAIRALGAKGGVMGITGIRNFVKASEPTGIDDVVDHIDHVAQLVGIEHVGIGSDADLYGYDALPVDQRAIMKSYFKGSYAFRDRIDIEAFAGPKKIHNLAEALIRRGYSDGDIQSVLGGNFQRLLAAAWK